MKKVYIIDKPYQGSSQILRPLTVKNVSTTIKWLVEKGFIIEAVVPLVYENTMHYEIIVSEDTTDKVGFKKLIKL